MERSRLLELRTRALVLARFPAVYRDDAARQAFPSSAALEYVLSLMEKEAGPLLAALTEELNATPEYGRLRCMRCLDFHPADRVRVLPEAYPGQGREVVCVPCLEDHHREELARADGAYEGRNIDDACERAAGRDD